MDEEEEIEMKATLIALGALAAAALVAPGALQRKMQISQVSISASADAAAPGSRS